MNAMPTATVEATFDALLSRILAIYPSRDGDYPAFLDGLGQRDRHLLVMQGLHSQVCNGGFTQWAENGYLRRDVNVLLLALARLRGAVTGNDDLVVMRVTQLTEQAARYVENAPNPERLEDEDYEALDALDDRFYTVSDRFAELMHAYFANWA